MSLHPATLDLLTFLNRNAAVRRQIRALPNKTLLYAGDLPSRFATELFAALPSDARPVKPKTRDGAVVIGVWNRLDNPANRAPDLRDKQILPQVLGNISLPGSKYANLLEYVKDVHSRIPAEEQDIIWRALSGIFASNAVGAVSFFVGGDITRKKVLATTEIPVLLRNPNVNDATKDMLAYYERCIARGDSSLVSLIHG